MYYLYICPQRYYFFLRYANFYKKNYRKPYTSLHHAWWGTHWRHAGFPATFYHLLHVSAHARGFQVAHTVETVGEGEHEIGGQRVVFGITDHIIAHYLHDVFFLVQDVVGLQRERGIAPTLFYFRIQNYLIHFARQLVAVAVGVAAFCRYIPRLRQVELKVARYCPVEHIAGAGGGDVVLRVTICGISPHTYIYDVVCKA